MMPKLRPVLSPDSVHVVEHLNDNGMDFSCAPLRSQKFVQGFAVYVLHVDIFLPLFRFGVGRAFRVQRVFRNAEPFQLFRDIVFELGHPICICFGGYFLQRDVSTVSQFRAVHNTERTFFNFVTDFVHSESIEWGALILPVE